MIDYSKVEVCVKNVKEVDKAYLILCWFQNLSFGERSYFFVCFLIGEWSIPLLVGGLLSLIATRFN